MSDIASLPSLITFSAEMSALVAHLAPSVAAVRSHRARSSGFVWRPGLIVTADEALAEEGEISVTLPGGEVVPATLVGRDPTTDIALLRVERADLHPAPFGTASVSVGAITLLVAARDGAPTAAFGLVSHSGGGWRSMRGGEIDARIELDATLRRSGEGGLAVDTAGRAFGMAVLGPRRRVLVIPSATIERIAAKLERHGRIARGYLGLGLRPVRPDGGGSGLMVMSVDGSGPGAAADIRQGDVVVAIDGRPIASLHSLLELLGPDSVGTTLMLSLTRGGNPLDAALTVGERPQA